MRFYIIVLVAFLFSACIKEYNPEIEKYSEVIVIDGMLTDTTFTPYIIVSRSVEVDEGVGIHDYLSGASVQIKSGSGESYPLQDMKNGRYEYKGNEIIGKVGQNYWVHIEYDGNTYVSHPETMLPVSNITAIAFSAVKSANGSQYDGVDMFVSTKGKASESRYVAWTYAEDWKFKVPVVSTRFANKQICWTNATSDGIMIGTSEALVDNVIDRVKVYRILLDNHRLSIRYSSEIYQYSLTRDTYKYLEHVQNVNNNNGSLFDPVPASVNGNIYCENNEDIPVIGNFQISSVSAKRVFIDRTDLPSDIRVERGFNNCDSKRAPIEDKRMQDSIANKGYVIMDTARIELVTYVRYAKYPLCFNCTASGAPNYGPDWWIEKED